jgi:Rad3-related DNA helicase
MVLMMTGTRLHKRVYRYTPDCVNEIVLSAFLEKHIKGLKKLVSIYKNNTDRLKEVTEELERSVLTKRGLDEDPQNYAIWEEHKTVRGRRESYLHVRPVKPPRFLMDKLLGADKLVLMSGTAFPTDIADLIGDRPFKFLDLPSPIPKSNRPIFYRPVPFPLNFNTDPAKIAKAVEDILDKHPGENAIVHVSYGLSEKIRGHFTRPILFNTTSNKDETLEKFKTEGGVFLAAGCAEGIDLSGDLARVNIIVKLNFPDLKDPTVLKRKAMEDGEEWYSLTTLKTTIQMAGRTTRHETDKSSTYVLDPNFGRLVSRYSKALPKSFTESIVWSVA